MHRYDTPRQMKTKFSKPRCLKHFPIFIAESELLFHPTTQFESISTMCAEDEYEKDGLLGPGSPSKDHAKEHRVVVKGWKRYVFPLVLTAAAFAGGYAFHALSSSNVVGRSANGAVDNSVAVSGAIEDGSGTTDGPSPLFNASFTEYLISGMKNILEMNKFGQKKTYYVYDSPFNLRWPDSERPTWVKKIIPFNKRTPYDKQICFVHVGKAGGSTGEFIFVSVKLSR
jgi:hypothetical protein